MEFTALKNGQLIASISLSEGKIWRRRVSGSLSDLDEEALEDEGPFAIYEPRELEFTMHPGREYTFNVGSWVSTDYSTGVDAAAVQALMEGDVLTLTLERDK